MTETKWSSGTVEQLSQWIPVTLEMLIDSGQATPEQVAQYQLLEAEREARWKALGWRHRFWAFRERTRGRVLAFVHRHLFGSDDCGNY